MRFRARTNSLLRRRWHVLTLATLADTSPSTWCCSCRSASSVSADEVTAVEAFAAWSLVRLLGSIPITPGGLGIVEPGLTTALVGFEGGQAEVVAAVLVLHPDPIVPTLLIGLLIGATWKRYRPDYLERGAVAEAKAGLAEQSAS